MRSVESTRRLAGKLCKEIAVGDIGHRAKDELRSHLQHLVKRTFLTAASQMQLKSQTPPTPIVFEVLENAGFRMPGLTRSIWFQIGVSKSRHHVDRSTFKPLAAGPDLVCSGDIVGSS